MAVRRQLNGLFEVPRVKNCQPRILYPAKLSFRNEHEITISASKQNLRQFVAHRPAVLEMLKEFLWAKTCDPKQWFKFTHTKTKSTSKSNCLHNYKDSTVAYLFSFLLLTDLKINCIKQYYTVGPMTYIYICCLTTGAQRRGVGMKLAWKRNDTG